VSNAFYLSGIDAAESHLGLTKVALGFGTITKGINAAREAATPYLGRTGVNIAEHALGGAALGAGIQGGVEAFKANDGERGNAFLHGAGTGALAGGAIGAGTGVASNVGKDLALRAERGLSGATRNVFQPEAAKNVRAISRGVPSDIAHQAAIGAGLGAGIEGAVAGNTAPEGEGRSAFLEGAAHGALHGGLGGAAFGLTGRLTRNATGMGMKSLANGDAAALKATQQRSLGSTLRDLVQPAREGNVAPLGRGGAAAELGARATNVAGEWVLPNYLLPGASAAGAGAAAVASAPRTDPTQERTASERAKRHPAAPDPVTLSTMAGSGLGAGLTGFAGELLSDRLKKYPIGQKAIGHFAKVPGAVAGAALGHYLGKTHLSRELPLMSIKPLSALQLAEMRDFNGERT